MFHCSSKYEDRGAGLGRRENGRKEIICPTDLLFPLYYSVAALLCIIVLSFKIKPESPVSSNYLL